MGNVRTLVIWGVFFYAVLMMCTLNSSIYLRPQIAENALNFYYMTKKTSGMKVFSITDSGYLPIVQRMIAIVFVKWLNFGVDSLYFMNFVGVLLDGFFVSVICSRDFDSAIGLKYRISLSLIIPLLFVCDTVCTFFNFIYLGIYFIIFLLMCDFEKVSLGKYAFYFILSILICLSKGFCCVFFPFSLIIIILNGIKGLSVRRLVFLCGIGCAGLCQLVISCVNGKFEIVKIVAQHRFFFLSVGGVAFFIYCLTKERIHYIYKTISVQVSMGIELFVLLCGLSTMVALFTGYTNVVNFVFFVFNWCNAWNIPIWLSAIILMLYIDSVNNRKIYHVVILGCMIVVTLLTIALTYNEISLKEPEVLEWSVFKDDFDDNVVPVFKECERFGTLADNCKLYYWKQKPINNYEFDIPYEMEQIDVSCGLDEGFYVEIPDGECVSAIYIEESEKCCEKRPITVKIEDGDSVCIEQKSPIGYRTRGYIVDCDALEGIGGFSLMGVDFSTTNNVVLITRCDM